MTEKTFEELALDESFRMNFGTEEVPMVKLWDVVKIMQQVREATIAEAVNYCVSQDWVKTIDNLKRMPTDRIIDFEKPTDRITITNDD